MVLLLLLSMEGGKGVNMVEATLADHKNMIYALPRPGVLKDDDCYTDIYADDIRRDLAMMKEMGVTTVMTWNGWNFGRSHSVLLTTMAKSGMSLGITFKPDLNGVMRKNLEKLQKALESSGVVLEFLYLDYPLDFDNAEEFFRWVIQVRSWMFQEGLTCPLLLRFFPMVSNPKTVQVLLQQWDEGAFDAWVVESYSTSNMVTWLSDRMENNQKQMFFLYGSDSWDMTNNNETLDTQEAQLEEMVNFIETGSFPSTNSSASPPSSNITDRLLSGAIQGYSDSWFLGSDLNYFQGGAHDVCPDKNPYLHTSCGGNDLHISHGDEYFSIEHMGLLKHYETIYYFRCLEPTPASRMLSKRWSPDHDQSTLSAPKCSLSISIPAFYVFYMWAAGFAVSLLGLCIGCCQSSCSCCQSSCCKKTSKRRTRHHQHAEP
jgi:hypothetical protein